MARLLIFGDSITYGGGDLKGGWVQRIREALDYKSLSTNKDQESDYSVYNLGISGDTTDDLVERTEQELKRRIDEEGDTIIIFAIGINDSQFLKKENEHHVPTERFKKNIQKLVDIARKYSNNIVFIGITPVDEKKVAPKPWNLNKFCRNEYIEDYNKTIKDICEANKVLFLDILSPFKLLNFKKLLLDGLHPNTDGYKQMSEIILSFLKEKDIIV